MKKLILIAAIAASVLLSGCDNPNAARRALEKAGFSDIKAGGYDWFACGQDDFYSTRFCAINSVGVRVCGTVCSGLIMKGATVRF